MLGADVPSPLKSPTPPEINAALANLPDSATEYVEFMLTVGEDSPDNKLAWFPPFELHPLDQVKNSGLGMVAFWETLQQLDTGYVDSEPPGAVKTDKSWRPNWLLIGQFDSDQLILDLDPGPDGTSGQVLIQQMHSMNVLANSISDIFLWLVSTMEKNADTLSSIDEFSPDDLPGYWDQPLEIPR